MKGIPYLTPLLLWVLILPVKANGTIYSWVDQQGKRHFGDQPSHKNHSTIFEGHDLVSIKIVHSKLKLSKRGFKRKVNSRDKQSNSNKPSCDELRRKITQLEQKLTSKHTPDKFDKYKQELNQFRWQKIKKC